MTRNLETARRWVERLGGEEVSSWQVAIDHYYLIHLRAIGPDGEVLGETHEEFEGYWANVLEWSPELDNYFFGELKAVYWLDDLYQTDQIRSNLWCSTLWDKVVKPDHPRDRECYLDLLIEEYQDSPDLQELVYWILRDGWEKDSYPFPELKPGFSSRFRELQTQLHGILRPLTPDDDERQLLIYRAMASSLDDDFSISLRREGAYLR